MNITTYSNISALISDIKRKEIFFSANIPTKNQLEIHNIKKATLIIMIYAFVEDWIKEILDNIHSCMYAIGFNKLRKSYQEISFRSLHTLFKSNDEQRHFGKYVDKIGTNIELSFTNLGYDSLKGAGRHLGLSGAIDSVKFEKIWKTYGLQMKSVFHKMSYDNLLTALDYFQGKRNPVCHGEISFSDMGQQITITEVEKEFKAIQKIVNIEKDIQKKITAKYREQV